MSMSIEAKPKKKRGRPATGKDPQIGVRLPPSEINRLDNWASATGQTRASAARKAIIDRLDQEGMASGIPTPSTEE